MYVVSGIARTFHHTFLTLAWSRYDVSCYQREHQCVVCILLRLEIQYCVNELLTSFFAKFDLISLVNTQRTTDLSWPGGKLEVLLSVARTLAMGSITSFCLFVHTTSLAVLSSQLFSS